MPWMEKKEKVLEVIRHNDTVSVLVVCVNALVCVRWFTCVYVHVRARLLLSPRYFDWQLRLGFYPPHCPPRALPKWQRLVTRWLVGNHEASRGQRTGGSLSSGYWSILEVASRPHVEQQFWLVRDRFGGGPIDSVRGGGERETAWESCHWCRAELDAGTIVPLWEFFCSEN